MKDPGLESLPPKFGLFFSMHTMYSTYRLVLVSSASLDSSLFPFLRCSVLDYVNLLLFFFLLSSFSFLFSLFLLSFFFLLLFFPEEYEIAPFKCNSEDSACHCSLIICLFFPLISYLNLLICHCPLFMPRYQVL